MVIDDECWIDGWVDECGMDVDWLDGCMGLLKPGCRMDVSWMDNELMRM